MNTNISKILVVLLCLVFSSYFDANAEWQRVSVGKYTNTAYDICIDQNDNLLLTSYDNFQLRDKNGNWTVFPFTDSLLKNIRSSIKYVISHPEGRFYFCADKGLYSIENGKIKKELVKFRQQAKYLEYDSDNNLWIAMVDSIVYKYHENSIVDSIDWKAIGDPYPTYFAQVIASDYRGRMWRINCDKLMMRDTNNILVLYNSSNSPLTQKYPNDYLYRNKKREIMVTTYEPSVCIMRTNGEWDSLKLVSLYPERFTENMRVFCPAEEPNSSDIVFFTLQYQDITERGIFRFDKNHKLIKEYPKPDIIEIDTSSFGIKYFAIDLDFDSKGNLYAVFNGILFQYIEDGVGVSETQDDFLEFAQIIPNPIIDKGRVKFYTNPCNSERIKFTLYDLYGRKVADLKGEIKIDVSTGIGEIEIDAEHFNSGAYIITASVGEMSYSTKVIIQK